MRECRRLLTAALLAAALALTGCTLSDAGVSVRIVDLPTAAYFDPVWLSDDVIAIATRADGVARVVIHQLSSGSTAVLSLADLDHDAPACTLPVGHDYLRLSRLPDGRLGAIRMCHDTWVDPTDLMAFDLHTGSAEVLAQLRASPTDYSWEPAMQRGYYSAGSVICHGIEGMIRGGGSSPADIHVGEGAARFPIDEGLRAPSSEDCNGQGRAMLAKWSPDGSSIAFVVTPAVPGVTNFARLDSPWSLYLMDPQTLVPVKVLGGVVHPQSLAWSPDGDTLALSATLDSGRGAWLFEPASGNLTRLHGEPVTFDSWSPDGSKLLGTRLAADGYDFSEVVVLELTDMFR